MVKRLLSLALFAIFSVASADAQDDFAKEYEAFQKSAVKEYEDFRKKCFKEYIEFLRQPWIKNDAKKPVTAPKVKPQPPVVYNEPDTLPNYDKLKKLKGVKIPSDKPKIKPKDKIDKKPIDMPVLVKDDSVKLELGDMGRAIAIGGGVIRLEKDVYMQPVPLSPIKEDESLFTPEYSFDVFGTECEVRIDNSCKFKLANLSENAVADALSNMMNPQFDNLLHDCLKIREEKKLSDWGYYEMLGSLVDSFYGKNSNEGTLVMAFLYMQSGYKMRLGQDGTTLYMLVSSKHNIFEKPFFTLDGENYFILRGPKATRMSICKAKFPKESSLSLVIPYRQELDESLTQERVITSKRYPAFSFRVKLNKNLIDFYNTYPSSTVNNEVTTRWAMYANAPMDKAVLNTLYPQIKEKIKGMSNLEAMEHLLNWVQTGFVYEYDDKVWGGDRAFFGEETLYYPYCDCEDRSILLSHLVRDLLGLDTVLIYYPGHLAMAVDLQEASDGDYVQLDGRRYVVCDPTYIGARVGKTMPKMDNSQAKLILLER